MLGDIVVGLAAAGDSVATKCSALLEHTMVEAE